MKKSLFLPLLICALLTLLSCTKKSTSCFDEEMYNQHHNDACTADCPGVKGCDGKTYCNECEARRQGIRIQ